MSAPATRPLPRTVVLLLTLGAAVALAGCVEQEQPVPEPTITSSGTPTPTPTASEEPDPEPTALDTTCAELVDPDVVYAFNPNFALLGSWTPDPATPGAEAVAAGGLACRWVLESGGGTMDLWTARLPEARLTELKNEAFATSEMVPTYGEEAYFSVEDGVGTAVVFEGPFWLEIASPAFVEPGEPAEIIDSALGTLAALPS